MRRKALAFVLGSSVAIAVSAMTTPASAQLGPVPEPTEVRPSRPNLFFLVPGAAIFTAAYVPGLIVAATSNREGDEWLYVPVVGPWADLANRASCSQDAGNCDNEGLYSALLVTAGIAQVVGLAAVITSFVVPEYRGPSSVTRASKSEVRLAPIQLARNGYGLGLGGSF